MFALKWQRIDLGKTENILSALVMLLTFERITCSLEVWRDPIHDISQHRHKFSEKQDITWKHTIITKFFICMPENIDFPLLLLLRIYIFFMEIETNYFGFLISGKEHG